MHIKHYALAFAWFALGGFPAYAAVSADEAAKLKTTLTPFGAERAGNADGSIPPWEGGLTKPTPGFVNGGKRPDPFAGEKPLFSISAKNVAQYADKLPEGTQLLFKNNPDYRVDVYKTQRSFAAPQYIYDRTARNATSTTVEGDAALKGYEGGIPFPVPKTGAEVMFNHQLRWQMDGLYVEGRLYFITAQGKALLQVENNVSAIWPMNLPTPAPKGEDVYARARVITVGPPISRGGAVVAWDNIDSDKNKVWAYLSGQRRVKMLPNACCDTPAPSSGGALNFDEVQVFQGSLKLFDWKILGKKEMYIPYNSNRIMVPTKDSDVVSGKYPNPDHVRWELHRVWAVEATLKSGKRHIYPRSVYYIDEDSWHAVHADRWDAQNKLAKTNFAVPIVAPDVPAVLNYISGSFDHITGAWFMNNVLNERPAQFKRDTSTTASDFNPDNLAGEGLR